MESMCNSKKTAQLSLQLLAIKLFSSAEGKKKNTWPQKAKIKWIWLDSFISTQQTIPTVSIPKIRLVGCHQSPIRQQKTQRKEKKPTKKETQETHQNPLLKPQETPPKPPMDLATRRAAALRVPAALVPPAKRNAKPRGLESPTKYAPLFLCYLVVFVWLSCC